MLIVNKPIALLGLIILFAAAFCPMLQVKILFNLVTWGLYKTDPRLFLITYAIVAITALCFFVRQLKAYRLLTRVLLVWILLMAAAVLAAVAAIAIARPRIAAVAVDRIAEGHGAGDAGIGVAAMLDRRLRRGDHDRRTNPGAAVAVAIAIAFDRAVAALPAGVAVPGLGAALDHGAAGVAGGGVISGAGLMGLGRSGDEDRRACGGVK